MVPILWKTVGQNLLKQNIGTPCDGTVLLPGIDPTEMPTCVHQKEYTRRFILALFIHNPG